MWTHNNDYPQWCKKCIPMKGFAGKYHLWLHLKQKHEGDSAKKFKCEFPDCQRKFISPGYLRSHYREYHMVPL